jgi:hypothetical protein
LVMQLLELFSGLVINYSIGLFNKSENPTFIILQLRRHSLPSDLISPNYISTLL